MEHTKLAIGDDETFEVLRVEEVKTGSWPDYVLYAVGGASFIAPKGALDRQFANLKVTPAQLAGHVVRLERAPNEQDAKKSWWNLKIVGKGDLRPAPSKRLTGPASPELPADGPPAHFKDIPLPESPEGELVAAAAEAVQGFEGKRGALIDGYLALYAYVAARLVVIGREHDFPVDGQSINAATATISIALDKRNLL